MEGETPYSQATQKLREGNQKAFSVLEEYPQENPTLERKRQAAIKVLKESDFPLQYFASRSTAYVIPDKKSEEEQHIPQWVARKHLIQNKAERLDVLYDLENPENPINGVVINTVGDIPAQVWEGLYTGRLRSSTNEIIPVAPILSRGNTQELRIYKLKEPPDEYQTTRVYSRYCGLSLENIDHIYAHPDTNPQREQQRQQFLSLISNKHQHLQAILEAMPEVPNPEPHDANTTVEFIEKQYYQDQLASGATVNTIPYNKDHWSFNPEEYMSNPDKWEAVVRMIDLGDQMQNIREIRGKALQRASS